VPAVPDWLVPPHEGWHFEDLLGPTPDSSQHIELIDGAFIPMSPPSKFHAQIIRNLQALLDRQCPAGLRADRDKTVWFDDDNGPQADVLVVRASAHVPRRPRSRRADPVTDPCHVRGEACRR